jgi:hypothetical protein
MSIISWVLKYFLVRNKFNPISFTVACVRIIQMPKLSPVKIVLFSFFFIVHLTKALLWLFYILCVLICSIAAVNCHFLFTLQQLLSFFCPLSRTTVNIRSRRIINWEDDGERREDGETKRNMNGNWKSFNFSFRFDFLRALMVVYKVRARML